MFELVVELLVKSTLVLLATNAICSIRRLAHAERHAVASIGLVAVVVVAGLSILPSFKAQVPAWHVTVPEQVWDLVTFETPAPADTSAPGAGTETVAPGESTSVPSPASTTALPSWLWWISGYMVVVAALGASTMAGRRRVSRYARNLPTRNVPPGLPNTVDVRVDSCATPWTWGVRRPVIVLPQDFDSWPERRRDEALNHELSHIRRHDCLVQGLSRWLCNVFWLQPLMWITWRRQRRFAEGACDDTVLAGGHDPCDYAETLLAIARDSVEARPLAMAATEGSLAGRVESILRGAARRNRMTGPKRCLVTALALAVVVPLGAVSIAVAQSESASNDALVHLAARVHALQPDDLSPQQAAVLEEIRRGLDALRRVDLDSEQASLLETVSGDWSASPNMIPPRYQVDFLANFVHWIFFREDLTEDEVAKLEAQLVEEPDNVITRTRLLGYYSHYSRNREEDARRARTEHVVWLIENAPYASVLDGTGYGDIDLSFRLRSYEAGKEGWQRHVEREPGNPVFVARYADFVRRGDPSLHIELLQRALGLDPEDFRLAHELGHSYLLRSKYPAGDPHDHQAAEKALAQFDRAYELAQDEIPRNHILAGRAEAAFAARRYDLAKQHAQAMLDAFANSEDGDLMHEGNTILGRIALIEGDVARAKAHLLESGKAPTSPVLGSFGPGMALASELLEQGERQVVLDYLELCADFWDDERLPSWQAAIKGGMTPDFGSNAR